MCEKSVAVTENCSQSDARTAGAPAGQEEVAADAEIRQDGFAEKASDESILQTKGAAGKSLEEKAV